MPLWLLLLLLAPLDPSDGMSRLLLGFWNGMVGPGVEPPKLSVYSRSARSQCGRLDPGNALYCPKDHVIYFDPQFLASVEKRFGVYARSVVLAHEWSHAVIARQPGPPPGPYAEERMADCLTGAVTRAAIQAGLAAASDRETAERTLMAAGASHLPANPGAARPSGRVRRDAFRAGLDRGTEACTAAVLENLQSSGWSAIHF